MRPAKPARWGAGSLLAALCADEDGVTPAVRETHGRCTHRIGRRARADRRHCELVDSLPWLQPPPHSTGRRGAARTNATRHVRWGRTRAGADACDKADRIAAGRSHARILY